MKLQLKRQTTFGCLLYFNVYKNGFREKRLFNNLPTELDVEVGDVLEFRKAWYSFSKKIIVTSDMKEITITTNYYIQQLFTFFSLLFLSLSILFIYFEPLITFIAAELVTAFILQLSFNYFAYHFEIEEQLAFQNIWSSR